MRLGVYGGTFNPIHRGHVQLVKEWIKRLQLDQLLLIPTATPPHKQAHDLASAEDRLAMCRLAVRDIPKAKVDDLEIRRSGASYTVDTLRLLRERFPQTELFLLMGEDMLLTLPEWREAEQLMKLATIAAAPRSKRLNEITAQQRTLEEQYGAKVLIEEIPFMNISSTRVRELIRAQNSGAGTQEELASLLPSAVKDYIQAHGIYGK